MATQAQIERVSREWSKIAGETVSIEEISGVFYAFGSELAALRLFYKMRRGHANYSQNRGSWYYVLD